MGHNTIAQEGIEKEERFKALCHGLSEGELYAVRRMKRALDGHYVKWGG